MLTQRDKDVLIAALAPRIVFLAAWWQQAAKENNTKLALYWHNEYADAKMLLDRLHDGTL